MCLTFDSSNCSCFNEAAGSAEEATLSSAYSISTLPRLTPDAISESMRLFAFKERDDNGDDDA